MKTITLRLALLFAAAVPGLSHGQTISFTTVPRGYAPGAIVLPRPFGGGLGVDPGDASSLYVGIGGFGDMDLARVDLGSGVATVVADGPFASIAGIAVISSTHVIVVDNFTVAGGPHPGNTVLSLVDNNPADGDFDDPGEVSELITPILVPAMAAFSGSQARLVPPGNPSGIPSGSLMFQTADGGGLAGLFVVADPTTAPAFRPLDAPYFGGFDFNGGFDFDSAGRIHMGTFTGSFSGEIFSLVNTNADDGITTGEFVKTVAGEFGMSDLTIDAEDDVFFAGFDPMFVASIRTYAAPADPFSETPNVSTFVETDAGFLSGLLVNSKTLPFDPFSAPGGAMMIMGGFTAFFESSAVLLTLEPIPFTAARDWARYP